MQMSFLTILIAHIYLNAIATIVTFINDMFPSKLDGKQKLFFSMRLSGTHLYERVCPSVCPSMRPSITPVQKPHLLAVFGPGEILYLVK